MEHDRNQHSPRQGTQLSFHTAYFQITDVIEMSSFSRKCSMVVSPEMLLSVCRFQHTFARDIHVLCLYTKLLTSPHTCLTCASETALLLDSLAKRIGVWRERKWISLSCLLLCALLHGHVTERISSFLSRCFTIPECLCEPCPLRTLANPRLAAAWRRSS